MKEHTIKGTAFITGGAKNIGKAMALALAKDGYNIALHYHSSKKAAEATAQEIKAIGVSCQLFYRDLRDSDMLPSLITEVFSVFPDCNILINNASLFEHEPFLTTEIETFEQHFDVNLKAPVFLTKFFAKQCKKGQVINMLDSYVTKNKSPYFAYLLSKKGLYDFTKMAAKSLSPAIRVNGLCLGLTEFGDYEKAFIDRKLKELPLGRLVSTPDITHTLLQIVHNQALTGACIFVDSGEQLL